jgi:hypothetical protein
MANFQAKVSKIGKLYYVTNVFMSEIRYIMPNDTFIDVSDEFALRLKNEVAHGKSVSIDAKSVESGKTLTFEDFTIKKPKMKLEERKREVKAKANAGVLAYTAMLSALDMYDFFCLFTRLASMGYNVMDESRKEEVYLEIINTGDDNLIRDLEAFLEAKEKFDRISKAYNGLRDFFREVDSCTKVSEITKVVEEHSGWLAI